MNEQFLIVDFMLSEWWNIDILLMFDWQIAYILMMSNMVDILENNKFMKDWFFVNFWKNIDFLYSRMSRTRKFDRHASVA